MNETTKIEHTPSHSGQWWRNVGPYRFDAEPIVFVPDINGGHLEYAGKVWRPTEEPTTVLDVQS